MAEPTKGASADLMAGLMALSLDAIVTKTRQGMITGWNHVAVDVYGYQGMSPAMGTICRRR